MKSRTRHSGESRNPGVSVLKSFCAIERFCIPAKAGMTNIRLSHTWKHGLTTRRSEIPRWKALILCLLAATAVALLLLETALAQEGTEYGYVDLVMSNEYRAGLGGSVAYSVKNNGTTIATGVTVSFLLEDLEADDNDLGSSIRDKRTENNTNQRFTWEAGTIPPGGSTLVEFSTMLHSGVSLTSGEYRIGVINATASSIEPEPDILLGNNSIKVYSFANAFHSSLSLHMANNRLGLLLSVDDLRPDAEGNVDFGLTAYDYFPNAAPTGHINAIADINIKVELSDGLKFKDSWTPPTEFTTSGRSATWRPEPVDRRGDTSNLAFPISREIEIETQLTSDGLNKIPREERCITAWVSDSKPPPTPGYPLGSLKQCLGDDPPVLFDSGVIDLLTVHHCVKVNNQILYPCRDSGGDGEIDNKLEMVAKMESAMARSYAIGRSRHGQPLNLRRHWCAPKFPLRKSKTLRVGEWTQAK